MAKSSKKTKDAISDVRSASEPQTAAPGSNPTATKNSATASNAGKPAPKRAGTAARKVNPATRTRKASSRKKAPSAQVAVSDEDIRIRAYFIAEKRAGQSQPGDSSSDWLEARRQLLAETAEQR